MTCGKRVIDAWALGQKREKRTEGAPDLAIVALQLDRTLEVIDRLRADGYISTKKMIGTGSSGRGGRDPPFGNLL